MASFITSQIRFGQIDFRVLATLGLRRFRFVWELIKFKALSTS
jgi:hypothetical protein